MVKVISIILDDNDYYRIRGLKQKFELNWRSVLLEGAKAIEAWKE